MRPHVLGIDDAPFHKDQSQDVPIVGVMMEGATLVEGIAIGSFPVDGEGATDYLAQWITQMRWHLTLQAVVLGGITLAGLGIIDLEKLAQHLSIPVMAVNTPQPVSKPTELCFHSSRFPGAHFSFRADSCRSSARTRSVCGDFWDRAHRCCTNYSSYPQ